MTNLEKWKEDITAKNIHEFTFCPRCPARIFCDKKYKTDPESSCQERIKEWAETEADKEDTK